MRGVGRFGPLRGRQFRLLWFARTGSSVGDSLIPVALIWAVSRVVLVPEVHSVQRRAEPEPEREPALSTL